MNTFYSKTTIIFFLVSSITSASLFAQKPRDDEGVRADLDAMFSGLDMSRVPTGYLRDYAFEHVDFDYYDGTALTDTNYVDPKALEEILNSVNSAAVDNAHLIDVDSYMTAFSSHTSGQVYCAAALYKYNYIVADALTNNKISYEDDVVSDKYINGIWQNPYADKYIAGVALNKLTVYGTSVTFNFASTDFHSNISGVSMSFDAGDGQGYRTVTLGTPISVSYDDYGDFELKFRFTVTGGITINTHSMIIVEPIPISPMDDVYPDSTFTVTCSNGLSAIVSVKYPTSGTHSNKPFIIAEGFDPYDISEKSVQGTTYLGNFYPDLPNYVKTNYDVYYIDWVDYQADIKQNAELLKAIIRKINTIKHTAGSTEKNVLMGQSMGGLISRYALRFMEINGEKHEVSVYISHDVPYKGVNVPLGAVYAVNDLFNYFNINSMVNGISNLVSRNKLKKIYDLYKSDSAKQMMINYVDPLSGNINNNAHILFFNELNNMGFPVGDEGESIENVAIINGGSVADGQIINSNGRILDIDFNTFSGIALDALMHPFFDIIASMLAMIPPRPFLGKMQINGHIHISPYTSHSATLSSINISYTKWFLWIFPKTYYIISSSHTAPSSGFTYDSVSGSLFHVPLEHYHDTLHVILPLVSYSELTFDITENILFVPTASSLFVSNFNTNYFTTPPEPMTGTPFSSFYLASSAEKHIVDFKPGRHGAWLEEVLSTSIEGPDIAYNDSTYCIVGGLDPSASYTWMSSNSTLLSINPNTGVVTPHGNGIATITARSYNYNNGRMYQKQKKIAVGYPNIVLTKSSGVVDTCVVVTATCADEEFAPLFQQLVNSGDYLIEWCALVEGSSPPPFEASNELTKTFSIEDPSKMVTVYCRIRTPLDTIGRTSMIVINKFEPFECLTTVQITRRYIAGQANGYYITINGNRHTLNPPRIPFITEQFLFQYSSPGMSILAPEPDTVVVNNQYSFPVTKYTEYLPDNTTVVFFGFDLFNSNFFHSYFTDPNFNYLQLLIPITLSFQANNETIQEIYTCINGDFLPLSL